MLGLKRSYNNDCKDNLRSGSGQLNKKYWHECHELWLGEGSAGTEPLDFGMETLSTETAQSEAETGSVDKEETPEISVNIQDDSDDGDSRSAPSVSSNTSCSESGAKSSRKRAQKSTKTFVDNKRKILQKKLTQEGTQDILLQHLQRQLKLQQPLSYYANQRFVTFHDFYMMST